MKLFSTIRSRLFFCYSTIIVTLITLLATLFYRYASTLLEQRASESLQQLSINTIQYLDSEIKNMNSLANRIISSEPIKSSFYDLNSSNYNLLNKKSKLFNLLSTTTGSTLEYQINLIGLNGNFVEFGNKFDIRVMDKDNIKNRDWFPSCLDLRGRLYIVPIVEDKTLQEHIPISIARSFSEVFGAKYDSIVEIQATYETFAKHIEKATLIQNASTKVSVHSYVFDEHGNQIYPAIKTNTFDYYEKTKQCKDSFGTMPIERKERAEIIAFSKSDYSNWTVVVSQTRDQLLQPVITFRNIILCLGILVLLITLFLSYIIARKLTKPIKEIHYAISNLNLNDLSKQQETKQELFTYELTMLSEAYAEMVSRLQDSLSQTVLAKSSEIQARMIALQAQMNPHFLYNTITVISIKAEDSGNTDIVHMCDSLVSMLRYVTIENHSLVTVRCELEYVDKYLSLMEYRYPDHFKVSTTLPDALYELTIPKLLLHPLIENCFKYAFHIRSPWLISVNGTIDADHWTISVTDNGVGFKEEVLSEYNEIIKNNQFSFSSNHKIGLFNIYYRLKIQYKEDTIFEIRNNEDSGATITIGGKIEGGLQNDNK
ncbi:cache domain-containing sensor histidine kinase [Lachnoclostridium sp.]|uniref:cache domain-containing sensor histidine kinase n=1 Tax=Lachnoclostridium sp. TaxID=2028282 RepID=UPI0028A06C92|nr:histidine kinase [Lachnoclostridium sp.]